MLFEAEFASKSSFTKDIVTVHEEKKEEMGD